MRRGVDPNVAAVGVAACLALACAGPGGTAGGAAAGPGDDAAATGPREGEIVVEVEGLRSDAGQALIALFRSPDGFPDDRDEAQVSAARPIRGGRARHVFSSVPPGPYAVAVLHDENENFKMDTNFLGIPREGYGASRNPAPRLGPPRYDDARLSLAPGERALVRIEVIYR